MAKLTFQRIDYKGEKQGDAIEVEYAPSEISFSKAAQYADIAIPGLNQPVIQFVRGDAETLSLELFFDSTQDGTGPGSNPVTAEVEAFHQMVTVQGSQHAPPLVKVSWGDIFAGDALGAAENPDPVFTAVVLSVSRRFTLFSPDGNPLRAVVSLSQKQYASVADQVEAINYQSSDHTRIHTVAEGETLPLIAHDAYSDAARWRVIAEANQLDEVRTLKAGTQLVLPPLVQS